MERCNVTSDQTKEPSENDFLLRLHQTLKKERKKIVTPKEPYVCVKSRNLNGGACR